MNLLLLPLLLVSGPPPAPDGGPPLIRSRSGGRWSDPAVWEGGRPPRAGDRVQVRAGHLVTYDIRTEAPIRSIHVAGTLRFDPDRDTRLDVGLIKIQAGDDPSETGSGCEAHLPDGRPSGPRPALEVGTAGQPIRPGRTAILRLAPVDGLDPDDCPAIVCCAGRMDFHGAALSRTWVKLGASARRGDDSVTLAERVEGWRVGDLVIVTATHRQEVPDDGPAPSLGPRAETEERRVRALDGTRLVLDAPLRFDHEARDQHRGEVANLSRNVVVESADPGRSRGHTMYHRHSAGSIAYAEFRHLGKPGRLGKYSLHFHRLGETMRGSSVVGASIWDSGNRWITIHGTDYLVVRDCVGYRGEGHGFFLEDGTESSNILDRNLAVLALRSRPLPDQILPYDRNEGAGFWWANSGNAFTRNVAVECDEYGFRYDARATTGSGPVLRLRPSSGRASAVDIRTVPFLRFEGNESHAQARYGVNLGGGDGKGDGPGVDGVGPDARHPFLVRDLTIWDTHWALTPAAPSTALDKVRIAYSDFGLWHPRYEHHAYRDVTYYRTRWRAVYEEGRRPVESAYPSPLDPVDDRPPVSVILGIDRLEDGRARVRGVAIDDGAVRTVRVNGREARPTAPGFLDWEATLDDLRPGVVVASAAEDAAGNVEPTPHRATIGMD